MIFSKIRLIFLFLITFSFSNFSQAYEVEISDELELVPKQWIVVLKDNVVDSDGITTSRSSVGSGKNIRFLAKKLVKRSFRKERGLSEESEENNEESSLTVEDVKPNWKIKFIYSKSIKGFAVILNEKYISILKSFKDVKYVVQDAVIELYDHTISTQSPVSSWGLDRINQRDLPLDDEYDYDYLNSSAHAYVIDTGIRSSHEDFSGRIGNGYDLFNNDYYPEDCNGHGTHVAGTIGGSTHGVDKNVILHSVKVFGCGPFTSYSMVIAGVDWVTKNRINPAVVNMSLGGWGFPPLEEAVRESFKSGVTYVVSAGNSNLDACNFSPAGEPTAITVGSTMINDQRSSFSNIGSCVDIFAPGSNITSSWISNNSDVNTISGTSMAAPHVTGVVAKYLKRNPYSNPTIVSDFIEDTASVNKLANIGTGSTNLLLFSGSVPHGCHEKSNCDCHH